MKHTNFVLMNRKDSINCKKYARLQESGRGMMEAIEKKVILVTATPLNNKPDDIRNQLYLFQDSKNLR